MEAKIIDYSEKSFAVIGDTKPIKEQLKKLGGRFNGKLSCGAGWIFSVKKRDEVEAFIADPTTVVAEPAKSGPKIDTSADLALLDEYMAEIRKCWSGHMLDHFRKNVSLLVRLSNGGILVFDKPSIKKDFCFGYSLSSYDSESYDHANEMAHHAATSEKYFLDQNLRHFDAQITQLETGRGDYEWESRVAYASRQIWGEQPTNNFSLRFCSGGDWHERRENENLFLIADDDKKTVLEALRHERAKFERRLHAYLKRYGMSKINTWSYWQDE